MKLELSEIFAVIDKVKEAGLASFSYEDEDISLKLKGGLPPHRGGRQGHRPAPRGPEGEAWTEHGPQPPRPEHTNEAPVEQAAAPMASEASEKREAQEHSQKETEKQGNLQASPMVGVFYASDQEGGEPLVKVGDQVKAGQVIGIVEAMKLMNEIKAEFTGTVEEVLVENGQMVEYGQPLFRIL